MEHLSQGVGGSERMRFTGSFVPALSLLVGQQEGHLASRVPALVVPVVSDIAIFVLKRDVKLQLTN